MKIGYVTIHYGNNFGTVLQTVALKEALIQKYGFEVELINYVPDHIRNKEQYNVPITSFKSLIIHCALPILNKYISKKYTTFISQNVDATVPLTFEEIKNKIFNYDVLLVGSDQVWNSDYNNGIDDIYFLDFAYNIKYRASYASSFGKDSIDPKERFALKSKLEKFDCISVREDSAKVIIEELGIQTAVDHVLDPVFLLSKEEWIRRAKKWNGTNEYILVYALDENVNNICVEARKIACLFGCKVIMITNFLTKNSYVDEVKCFETPEGFLSMVLNAKYVFTNSFHGVAFSVIFNKQFISFTKSKYNSRITSLLNIFGLSDRQIPISSEMVTNLISSNIDYQNINHRVKQSIEHSYEYLNNAFAVVE